MLVISVQEHESFNEAEGKFIETGSYTLLLEHSLASLSKWEAKWERPFLGREPKTQEQTLDYIRQMCLTPDVPPEVFSALKAEDYRAIDRHINAKMTATWFSEQPTAGRGGEVITAEIIYYWMVSLNIPFECDQWHLNKLLTLIKVCNEKNAPKKKMSRAEIARRNSALNAARQKQLGTTG